MVLSMAVWGILSSPFLSEFSEDRPFWEAQGNQRLFVEGHDEAATKAFLRHLGERSSSSLETLSSLVLREKIVSLFKGAELIERWDGDHWYFSYSRRPNGEALMVVWQKPESKRGIQLDELVRAVMDERLAQVTSLEEKKKWEEKRAEILGSLVDVRKERRSCEAFIVTEGGREFQSHEVEMKVGKSPLVLRIYPYSRSAEPFEQMQASSAPLD